MTGSEPGPAAITDHEFDCFRRYIYECAGITLAPHKRHLVVGRLWKRLAHFGLDSYTQYLNLLRSPSNHHEHQVLVDLLTTHETYFFREHEHFEVLRDQVLPDFRNRMFRCWSAACSSGEEVYSLAMVLAEALGGGDWEVLGSDISERVLETAQAGLYPMDRARKLPRELLAKYCLKGVRSHAGCILVEPRLKQRVRFEKINLKQPLLAVQTFNLVFLRNVLIYFDMPTRQQVVTRIVDTLVPGGYLFISHVESLQGITSGLLPAGPSVFRKPVAGR